MDVVELMNGLGDHMVVGHAYDSVVVIDKDSGKTFSIKDVVAEVHDDGDGSTTVWIQVEEN